MPPNRECSVCGQSLPAPAGGAGVSAAGGDQTVSRSMLMPLPNSRAGRSGEMIARLEPGTYRLISATAPLAELLGLGPDESRDGALRDAVLNLLMNAEQAIEDSGRGRGRIVVSTRSEGDRAIVEIGDDGCGIAPESLPRIFDPFFTTKAVGRGTGLGLSLAHSTIVEHGGTIDVASEPGVGTTFRIALPIGPGARAVAGS